VSALAGVRDLIPEVREPLPDAEQCVNIVVNAMEVFSDFRKFQGVTTHI